MLNKKEASKLIKIKKLQFTVFFLLIVAIAICLIFRNQRLTAKKLLEIKEIVIEAVDLTENEPTKKQIVCLDPGHGGKDVGAIYGKLYESNINLNVALQTKSILENEGYTVLLTRTSDTTVAKRARATYCNSVNADILVSIHHNSYDSDNTVDYATALYYKDSDQLLASGILASTADQLEVKSQGISKFDNSLLWIANMPAALSEAFFISNKSEYSLVTESNSVRLANEAQGIATGIINYFAHPEQIETLISDDPLVINRTDLED